jgi:hypothetical protein
VIKPSNENRTRTDPVAGLPTVVKLTNGMTLNGKDGAASVSFFNIPYAALRQQAITDLSHQNLWLRLHKVWIKQKKGTDVFKSLMVKVKMEQAKIA